MVPIAGVILTFVMTLELIQMLPKKQPARCGHLDDLQMDVQNLCAVLLVTNTWNIVMGVFDMAQSVVAQRGHHRLRRFHRHLRRYDRYGVPADGYGPRPLFGLWFQSLFVGITMWALYICILSSFMAA